MTPLSQATPTVGRAETSLSPSPAHSLSAHFVLIASNCWVLCRSFSMLFGCPFCPRPCPFTVALFTLDGRNVAKNKHTHTRRKLLRTWHEKGSGESEKRGAKIEDCPKTNGKCSLQGRRRKGGKCRDNGISAISRFLFWVSLFASNTLKK